MIISRIKRLINECGGNVSETYYDNSYNEFSFTKNNFLSENFSISNINNISNINDYFSNKLCSIMEASIPNIDPNSPLAVIIKGSAANSVSEEANKVIREITQKLLNKPYQYITEEEAKESFELIKKAFRMARIKTDEQLYNWLGNKSVEDQKQEIVDLVKKMDSNPGLIYSVFSGTIETITGALSSIWDFIYGMFKGVWEISEKTINSISNWFKELFNETEDKINQGREACFAILTKTPDMAEGYVGWYLKQFSDNPALRSVLIQFKDNPNAFVALTIFLPLVMLGGVSYIGYKIYKHYNETSDDLQDTLNQSKNTNDPKIKKKLDLQAGYIAAQAITLHAKAKREGKA